MEGTTIGAYRILNQIGEGGMGSVWMAEHAMLGRRAAVKLLHPSFSTRADIVQRFFNEARAATSISDPGIVQIFDFGHQENGQAYIVMELLEGEALDRRLQNQGKLPVHEALRIMRQVSASLGAAHARGIIHRDLKPENIFMVRDNEVIGGERAKILDFGIAKLGEQSGVKTQTNALMGTPSYMSPEQCRGSGKIDAASDVYALGCVMFALITGLPPFVADGHGELIVMHMTQTAPPLSSRAPHVNANIDMLVAKCLEKEPQARFANGTELAGAIGMLMSSVSNSGMPRSTNVTPAAGPQAATYVLPQPGASSLTGPPPPPAGTAEHTTLGGAAASKSVLTTREGRPNKLLIGALVAVAAIGGAIAVVMMTGGKKDTQVAATAPEPTPTPTPTPEPVPTPTPTPPPPPPPEVPAAGSAVAPVVEDKVSITVESTPPGAQVFVSGESKARGKTPYKLEVKKADAAFEIKLVSRGYVSAKRTVSPATDTKVAVTLTKPKRTSGGGGTKPVETSDETLNPFAKKNK